MSVLSLNELRAVMERNGATGFLTKVMVAGALTESSGNTDAVGDGGHSIGIFQLHDQGLGHGMTAAQRRDPDLSTRRMLEPYRNGLVAADLKSFDGEDRATKAYLEAERPFDFTNLLGTAATAFRGRWRSLVGWDLADALVTQVGFLTGDVAAALQDSLDGGRAADANPPQARLDAYEAIQAAINTLRESGPVPAGVTLNDLINLVGFLTGDIAQALQGGLDGARATEDPLPPSDRQDAYSAIQAAINTLRSANR
jgi:hypothetical protein